MGFAGGFGGVALGFAVASILIFFIQPQYFANKQLVGPAPKTSLLEALEWIWRDPILLAFAVALIFVGFLNNGVLQFENVYLSELGASKGLISVAGILSAVVELPFMVLADKIVRRVSAPRLVLMAFVIIIIQRLLVLVFPSITSIMVARFIGGTSFSFYTVAFIGLISGEPNPIRPELSWHSTPSPSLGWSPCWPPLFQEPFSTRLARAGSTCFLLSGTALG